MRENCDSHKELIVILPYDLLNTKDGLDSKKTIMYHYDFEIISSLFSWGKELNV